MQPDTGSPETPSTKRAPTKRQRSRALAQSSAKRRKEVKAAEREEKKLELPQVLESDYSPLYGDGINIKAVLDHPLAQDTLGYSIEYNTFLCADSNDRSTAIALFKEHGWCKRHQPSWIFEAIQASQERAAGHYDSYLEERFREEWGEEDEYLSEDEVNTEFSVRQSTEENDKMNHDEAESLVRAQNETQTQTNACPCTSDLTTAVTKTMNREMIAENRLILPSPSSDNEIKGGPDNQDMYKRDNYTAIESPPPNGVDKTHTFSFDHEMEDDYGGLGGCSSTSESSTKRDFQDRLIPESSSNTDAATTHISSPSRSPQFPG